MTKQAEQPEWTSMPPRYGKALTQINQTLMEMVDETHHDTARQRLLEIIAHAAGYAFALLAETEADGKSMRITTAYVPKLRSIIEQKLGFTLIGYRFPNDPAVALKSPPLEVFDHLSDYHTPIPRVIGKAIEILLGIRSIAAVRQHTGDHYLGAATFFATALNPDLPLLEYLCNHHLVYALRLIQAQSEQARLRTARAQELEQAVQERTKALNQALEQAHSAEEKLSETYLGLVQSREEEQVRLRETQNLLEGLRRLVTASDVQEILTGMLDTLRGMFDFEQAFILTLGENGHFKTLVSTAPQFEGAEFHLSQFFERILAGKTLIAFDASQLPEWKAQPAGRRAGVVSALHIPLITPDSKYLLVCTHSQRGFFTHSHVRIAERFSALAVQALQKAEILTTLRQQEERYRALFEQANDGIFTLDPQARTFIHVNRQAAKMLGYEVKELIGRPLTLGTAPDERQDGLDRFTAVLQGQIIPVYERTFVRRDGSRFKAEINLSLVTDAQGQPLYVQSVVRDVTERKRAEAALAEERAKLEQRVAERTADLMRANRLKDEFLAAMSHELRTPLTAILGITQSYEEGIYGPFNDKQAKALRTVGESGRHLLSLINDILDVSKIEAGKAELELDAAQVEPLCRAALRLVKESAAQKRLKTTFTYDESLTLLRADERRLKQILVNLLSNAVKFTPEGGAIGLEVTGDVKRQVVHFTVWDMGIGIAAQDLPQLFQPFTQLDARLSRQYNGTGLGLTLVRQLAELHGGSVAVESEVGKGSRFTVSLPWIVPKTGPLTEMPFITRALLVEDAPADAEQLRRYLKEFGAAEVNILPTGREAVQKAAELQPDIILLDILLPDQSGWEILQSLKDSERARAIPVIIVSVMDKRAEGLRRGAAEYLVKPVTRGQLREAIRRALQGIVPTVPAAAIATPAEPQPATGPLILLAEDNPTNADLMTDYLQAQGYRLVVADDGAEAVERARQVKPALILMDIQMPVMDGLEATRLIRADEELKDVPIIALTALAMSGDRERCLAAGANDYFTKPVNLKALVERMESLIEIHSSNSPLP